MYIIVNEIPTSEIWLVLYKDVKRIFSLTPSAACWIKLGLRVLITKLISALPGRSM